jgi:hypothetical protein
MCGVKIGHGGKKKGLESDRHSCQVEASIPTSYVILGKLVYPFRPLTSLPKK